MEVLTHVDEARIRDLLARHEFFWLDLLGPDEATIDRAAALLELPPFAVEDAKEFGQRPKLDDYGDKLQLVFYGADEGEELVEVHLHLSGDWVLTMRRASCRELERPRRAVETGEVRSELDLVFRILDALADSLSAKVERIGERVDEIEEAAFAHPDDEVRKDIALLRPALFRLGQILRAQAMLMAGGGDVLEHLPGLEGERARHPFREVHDVLVTTTNRVEALREQLAEALGIYLTSSSNQLNVLATRLALLGSIFLPLTAISGFFGQNFGFLVRHITSAEAFWGLGLGLQAGVLVASLALGVLGSRRR